MILKRITLTNFGIYSGVQNICLCPQQDRNIVLFGGKNGAGKSTLLEAIRLCFHGQYAARDLQVGDSYEHYLASRIHSNPTAVIQPTSAGVEIEFDYAENGSLNTYSVTRSWERKSASRVVESFFLQKNRQALTEVSAEHWQDFIRDLIPSGISQLFFFDGEKIQQLAEDHTDQLSLAGSIKALLGLDIIERLQADLSIYRSKGLKTSLTGSTNVLHELTERINGLRGELADLLTRRDAAATLMQRSRSAISELEQTIGAKGGGFAKNRERLLQQRTELRTKIEVNERWIRDVAGGLLPFVIALPLCQQLAEQLGSEAKIADSVVIKSRLLKLKGDLSSALDKADFWEDVGVSPKRLRSALKRLIADRINAACSGSASATRQIHKLSTQEGQQLARWVGEAEGLIEPLKRTNGEMEQLYRELQRTEQELAHVPSEEVIKPLFEELTMLHSGLGAESSTFILLEDKIKTTTQEFEELQRQFNKQSDELAAKARQQRNVDLSSTINKALDEYKREILERKVRELESAISECFNVLSRKKDAIRTVHINSADFSVCLRDRNQRALSKSELSAGEKQIYAVAVLWGLAKISRKPLPLIVDTPLARLDSDHRRLLAENYFPYASQQVIILSTDTEIDRQCFNLLKPRIGRSYRLEYLPEENGTVVKQGYFWDEVN